MSISARSLCVALLGVVVARGAAMQIGVAQWIDRTPPGKQARFPRGIKDCAMVIDQARRRIVLFGGKTDVGSLADGLWTFDLSQPAWQEIQVDGPRPPGISNASAISDPIGRRMIVYGGDRELWALDLETLRWRNMSGKDVPRRESHSAIYDERGKRMVVFGGDDGGRLDLHEVWALDLDPGSASFEKWRNLTVEEGHPPGRVNNTAVYDAKKNRMVIHAGYARGARRVLDDTWAYVFAETRDAPGRWMKLNTGTLAPLARRQAVGVYDATRNWFVVEGGESDQKMARKPVYLNDVWALDLTLDAWLPIAPTGSWPSPRVAPQAVYDAVAQSVVFYGGLSGDEHVVPHDVWELRLPAVSAVPAARGSR